MALLELPATVKIIEARLAIQNAIPDAFRSAVNRAAPFPPAFRELWTCKLALAPMLPADAEALAAFCERLDGRVTAFKMPMTNGIFGNSAADITTIAADLARGESLVTITGAVPAPGALFTLGDIEADAFQMFEVVAGVTSTTFRVAPRARYAFTTAAALVKTSPPMRWRLASDVEGRPSVNVSRGVTTLNLVEAV